MSKLYTDEYKLSVVLDYYNSPLGEIFKKENLLNRDFQSGAPGQKFVTDITYIPTPRIMVYLCTIIDLFNNEPVAWTVNTSYVEMLNDLEVMQSMSRKGNCWDNAKAESFFSHFKCETIHLMKNRIQGFDDVKEIVEEYMEYYTNQRPQKALGGLSPRA